MNRLLRGLFLVGCGLWLALSQPVAAQWTSAYPNVNVAGNFNGYETLTPNMQLISNGVWISYQTFSDFLATNTRIEALFATPSFTAQTWKALQPQTDFLVPIAATAAPTAHARFGHIVGLTGLFTGIGPICSVP